MKQNDIKELWESKEKFDEVRGEENGRFKDLVGDIIPPYGYYRTAKFIKDTYNHPKEGIDVITKGGKVALEYFEEIMKNMD